MGECSYIPGSSRCSFENGCAAYRISEVGTEDRNVQLKQNGIVLEQGAHYKVTFKAKSSEGRTIKLAMLSPSYNWYGGEDLVLDKDYEVFHYRRQVPGSKQFLCITVSLYKSAFYSKAESGGKECRFICGSVTGIPQSKPLLGFI